MLVLIGGLFVLDSYVSGKTPAAAAADYKDTAYFIEGEHITLRDGVAETEAAPGSASKVVTRYFGNELRTDLNEDGREDVVFLLTQQLGGSGTFYYVVAALSTEAGYVGSDGYFLGDHIAPQDTQESQNSRHRNVIVVNYAEREHGEPMTAQPTVGRSVFLKLDPASIRWGVVEPDFEGESASGIRGIALLGPTCPVVMDPPDPQCADKPYKTTLAITTADQSRVIQTVSTSEAGTFEIALPPGEYAIRSAAAGNVLPYCASNGTVQVGARAYTEVVVSCDTGIR